MKTFDNRTELLIVGFFALGLIGHPTPPSPLAQGLPPPPPGLAPPPLPRASPPRPRAWGPWAWQTQGVGAVLAPFKPISPYNGPFWQFFTSNVAADRHHPGVGAQTWWVGAP